MTERVVNFLSNRNVVNDGGLRMTERVVNFLSNRNALIGGTSRFVYVQSRCCVRNEREINSA